ncbi:unnamed protein product [Effrenium voratum]|uniref:Globin domain-containing protein n=1 Tax=Effrenium voratum TaxID=2562239 RepID=A0AA36JIH5_9DINO|nr:unnamed protein product [Effrenium voratum]
MQDVDEDDGHDVAGFTEPLPEGDEEASNLSDISGVSLGNNQPQEVEEDIDALISDVQDHVFGEMRLPEDVLHEVQSTWTAFLAAMPSRDAAGEAIYGVVFDCAPELQSLFKTARSVMAMRFVNGLNLIFSELARPTSLKVVTETLGFQHLDIEVTTPRVCLFRDAILDVLESEVGSILTPQGKAGFLATLNYVGGAMIYVRREYGDRISVLRTSWIAASIARLGDDEDDNGEDVGHAGEPSGKQVGEKKAGPPVEMKGGAVTKVPQNFNEMFLFNAAVMGFTASMGWMSSVLEQFENMVLNAAKSNRLQEECDVLSLVLVKSKEAIVYAEFKAVMLASLRSLVPKIWGVEHEVAWTWFWDNLERMIKSQVANLKGQQRSVDRFIKSLDDQSIAKLCRDVYKRFFEQAPSGQNFFKQSTTRLYFIAGKVLEMSLDIYLKPREMIEEISALGLRHVGYGMPTELFPPFIEAWSQSIQSMQVDARAVSSLRWSLTLISKCLVRTILEGSTIVMKAINTNSAKRFRKAISIASRQSREQELLKITVGTQSISPLYWAIQSGSFQVARAMLTDLLTIRADRDNYYYGCDALFERHPDILQELCAVRGQGLLPTMLDGLCWRSKWTIHKMRRVNYFVKHLIQNSDGTFNTSILVLVKLNDPNLIRHPVVSFVFKMLWSRMASYSFLQSRIVFLFLVVLVVVSQSILPRVNVQQETNAHRAALFASRMVAYLADLGPLLFSHVWLSVKDVRRRSFVYVAGVLPMPAYLGNLTTLSQLFLVFVMLLMCTQEPIFACLQDMYGDFPGAGLFTTHCPAAVARENVYSVLSQLSVLLHWLLLTDLCIFSLRVCAYLLTCLRVLVELFHFCLAVTFLIAAFSCAIASLGTFLVDFYTIPAGAGSLLRIILGMYENKRFVALREFPRVYSLLVIFCITTLIFLANLLVAQLTGAYKTVYGDMEGYAKLARSSVTVDTIRSQRPRKWAAFLASLKLEDRIEFNEGDVGMAGGIQVLEPANLNPTYEECIHRFGGSTSVENPWPEESSLEKGSLDIRLKRLEKLVVRATKNMMKGMDGGSIGSGTGSSAASSFASGASSGSSMNESA